MDKDKAAAVRGEIAKKRTPEEMREKLPKWKANLHHYETLQTRRAGQIERLKELIEGAESELSALGGGFKVGDRVVCEGVIQHVDERSCCDVIFDNDEGCLTAMHKSALRPAAPAPAEGEIATLKAQKDGAYAERNKLVAALSKIFPASVERHEGEDWEDDWRNVVYIDLPTGQASWHIHDSEVKFFEHLPFGEGRKWDGHTNDEKYQRVLDLPNEGYISLTLHEEEYAGALKSPAPVAAVEPAVEGEPVGWVTDFGHGLGRGTVIHDTEEEASSVRSAKGALAVFTHPAPVSGAVAASKGVVEAINNLFRNADLLVELADEDTDSEDFAARLADTKEALLNVKPLLAQITELPEPSEYVKQQCKMNSDCRIVLNFPANKSLDYAAALIEAAAKEGK